MTTVRLHIALVLAFSLAATATLAQAPAANAAPASAAAGAAAETADSASIATLQELDVAMSQLGKSNLNGHTGGHYGIAKALIIDARQEVHLALRLHAQLGPSQVKSTSHNTPVKLDGSLQGQHPVSKAAYDHLIKAAIELKKSPLNGHTYGAFNTAYRAIVLARLSIELGVKIHDRAQAIAQAKLAK
jgi:hypothetical protein